MKSRGTNTIAHDPETYEQSRFNAPRRGVLSGYAVLPWEDVQEYTHHFSRL
jgi:hypothetical protein